MPPRAHPCRAIKDAAVPERDIGADKGCVTDHAYIDVVTLLVYRKPSFSSQRYQQPEMSMAKLSPSQPGATKRGSPYAGGSPFPAGGGRRRQGLTWRVD